MSAATIKANAYRVEVWYHYKRKKGGVCLGMTVEADSEESAIEKCVAQEITPHPSRVHLMTTATRIVEARRGGRR